jgi:hypothetical protein
VLLVEEGLFTPLERMNSTFVSSGVHVAGLLVL